MEEFKKGPTSAKIENNEVQSNIEKRKMLNELETQAAIDLERYVGEHQYRKYAELIRSAAEQYRLHYLYHPETKSEPVHPEIKPGVYSRLQEKLTGSPNRKEFVDVTKLPVQDQLERALTAILLSGDTAAYKDFMFAFGRPEILSGFGDILDAQKLRSVADNNRSVLSPEMLTAIEVEPSESAERLRAKVTRRSKSDDDDWFFNMLHSSSY
jgi:hypothetical protein